jgi:hypothetical protein
VVIYDENLYERARTQWQFGDWESLAQIEYESLIHHPQRAKLALLVASGHQQRGDTNATREFTRLAQGWGASKKLVSQVLIAGVYNTLGKASALCGQQQRALGHFEQSLRTGGDGGDVRLLAEARVQHQSQKFNPHDSVSLKKLIHSEDRDKNQSTSTLVSQILAAKDIYQELDQILDDNNFTAKSAFDLLCAISDHFKSKKDKITALHFLKKSENYLGESTEQNDVSHLVQKYIDFGQMGLAADLYLANSLDMLESGLPLKNKQELRKFYEAMRDKERVKSEHGHDLLLGYLKDNVESFDKGEKLNVIEVGSTREEVPGQGSTRKIAQFCKEYGLHFISVDMDPHNTKMAQEVFRELNAEFVAVNMKGEEFLAEFDQNLDFVFLDAYDFDHGGHSDLRQSRYEKFLGAPIDDQECHRMHLTCAEILVEKLSPEGVICLDDTWLDNGEWKAKGTLAMPYLLENGFQLLEARNRAALLSRVKKAGNEQI